MRYTKFRAWDRDGGFMHNDVLVDGDGTIYTSASKLHDTSNREIEKITEDRVYVMQYTGLKDKNGKEIYEGDIFEITRGKNANYAKYRSEVIFAHALYSGMGWKLKGYFGSEGELNDGRLSVLNSFRSTHGEVIGNIYENPELLK